MMMRSVGQKNGEAGSVLIEFALTILIILIVLFGITDVGRAAFAYDWVANAARIGTRYAIVRGTSCSTLLSGCNVGPPQGAKQSDVQAYLNSQAIGINTSKLTVAANCDVGQSVFQPLPCAPGQAVIVKVKYTFSFISPLIPLTWDMKSSSSRVVSQ
jgi:Flp pilus assembly protein TadG